MKIRVTKRRAGIGLLTLILTLAGVGTAVAYWTNSGGGSGTVNVASGGTWFSVASTTPGTQLYPGASVTVNYTVTNTDSVGHYLHDVTVSLGSLGGSCTTALAALSANGGALGAGAVTVATPAQNVSASGGTYSGSFTLAMADTSSDQSACEGAGITLSYSTN